MVRLLTWYSVLMIWIPIYDQVRIMGQLVDGFRIEFDMVGFKSTVSMSSFPQTTGLTIYMADKLDSTKKTGRPVLTIIMIRSRFTRFGGW